jgi:Tol biopolymer transport system component
VSEDRLSLGAVAAGKYSFSLWRGLLLISILTVLLIMGFEKTAYAAFPGTNGKIVFEGYGRSTCSCSTEGNADIYTMNRDGSGRTNLTANSSAGERNPKMSPDGTKIVFERQQDYSTNIYVMNANGSGVTKLTSDVGTSPTWSPSGTRIAFVRDRAIYSVNVNGSGLTRLAGPYENTPRNLDWSPDGTKIAFENLNEYYDPAIFVVNADGSNLRNLSGYEHYDDYNYHGYDDAPSWSPDGTQIAFDRGGPAYGSVYVMNADGTNKQELSYGFGNDPAWSPDGTKIIYQGDFDLYMMDAQGGNVTQMTTSSASVFTAPDWGRVPPPDTIQPVITGMSPKNASFITDRTPTIKATVRDDRTNLQKANIKLYVNGALIDPTKYSYSSTTDVLTYNSPLIAKGKKTVKIVATDAAKNVRSTSWYFTIK